MDLSELRTKINSLDERLLDLLTERRQVAQDVITVKEKGDLPLRDPRREEDLLARLIAKGRERGLDSYFVTRVFHEIIDDSVRSQELFLLKRLNGWDKPPDTVGFQGIEGAYSHLAASKFFGSLGENISYRGFDTFAQVVEAVEDGSLDFAALPVENTTAGNINDVYDLLSRTKLSIVGEEIFRVQHCLLALDDVPVSRIRRVISHPQALAQCDRYLSQLSNCRADYYTDTAMAVRKVKEDGDPTLAAIASEEAGRIYGLHAIATDIANQAQNFTRFVIVAPQPIRIDSRIPSKTSLIAATPHTPGALNKALDVLSRHELNMTKLDARPKPGSPFDYLFYIDFEGHAEETHVKEALAGLRAVTTHLKILGSYPREQRGKTQPRVEALFQSEPTEVSTEKPSPTTESASAASTDGSSRLVSRESKRDDTILRIGKTEIGGDHFVVLAGASGIQTEDEGRQIARAAKEHGAGMLRAGRLQSRAHARRAGLSLDALNKVARIGREYELPVVVEVDAAEDVALAAERVDVLLVGADNMQNFPLLDEIGKQNKAVILKRGKMASIEEFLGAAEYIAEHGNHQIILCERGIRTFETVTRNTLDLGAIPILKRLTHLPILVDPCHAANQKDLVVPLALAAHAVGPHGLIVEIATQSTEPGPDDPQPIDPETFAQLMHEIYGASPAGT
ncbi:MAG: prephenate dehydratase domain-containing protein [Planctomycetota bacterium]